MQQLYLSIFHLPTILIVVLALCGQHDRLNLFIRAFGLSLVFTMAIFFVFPAITPLFYLTDDARPYIPATGVTYLSVIDLLRSGAPYDTAIHQLYGIVTFPSFHAASALLFAWGAWASSILRYPFLAINLGMLFVTPIEGSHYLIDLAGGLAVAALAIWIVVILDQRRTASATAEAADASRQAGPVAGPPVAVA